MSVPPLSAVLAEPDLVTELSAPEWELLMQQARTTNLVARIARIAFDRGHFARVPPRPRNHLEAARRPAAWQHRTVRWEVDCIRRALAPLATQVILLKGAAYLLAELPAARGRLFSDVDIMVPRDRLRDVERALFGHGWHAEPIDPYDQRYYREWMHELPPMVHVRRQTALDVHHTIAPLTARLPVDAAKLFAAARPLPIPGFFVLAPADMVLHSVIHLFQEGQFDHGLRDLVDVDDLLRHFAREPSFWADLIARAGEHGLGRPLYYAVQQLRHFCGTPMPPDFVAALERFQPDGVTRHIMSAVLRAGIAGQQANGAHAFADFSRWLLYIRGHYLRMPMRLLLPHLARKGLRRQVETGEI
jgi:hypothetical protein